MKLNKSFYESKYNKELIQIYKTKDLFIKTLRNY